jgi:hypothetical protein
MPKLAIAPAHHFLIYVRGAESLLGGIGIVAAVRGVGRLVPSATREATQAAAVVVIAGALIWLALPEYSTRDAHMVAATFSDNQWAAVQWIQNQASPNGVFLAPENTGVSMIGLVGRKTVIVERIFSNPYVDWDQRDTERRAMWDSLVASNCSEFSKHADPLGVTYLLLVDGMTPPIQEGTCGFTRKFDGPPFAIYARQFGHF